MMAAVVTENEIAQPPAAAAASDNDNARPAPAPPAAKLLDPQLLMAACHGDSGRLKELLRLVVNDGDGEENAPEASAEASKVIIMEVVPRRPPAAAAASAPPPLDR